MFLFRFFWLSFFFACIVCAHSGVGFVVITTFFVSFLVRARDARWNIANSQFTKCVSPYNIYKSKFVCFVPFRLYLKQNPLSIFVHNFIQTHKHKHKHKIKEQTTKLRQRHSCIRFYFVPYTENHHSMKIQKKMNIPRWKDTVWQWYIFQNILKLKTFSVSMKFQGLIIGINGLVF